MNTIYSVYAIVLAGKSSQNCNSFSLLLRRGPSENNYLYSFVGGKRQTSTPGKLESLNFSMSRFFREQMNLQVDREMIKDLKSIDVELAVGYARVYILKIDDFECKEFNKSSIDKRFITRFDLSDKSFLDKGELKTDRLDSKIERKKIDDFTRKVLQIVWNEISY